MKPSQADLEKDVEEQENLLSRTSEDSDIIPQKLQRRQPSILVGILALLVGLAVGALVGVRISPVTDGRCVQRLSGYSVITEDLDIHYENVRFNGSLMKANIYRQRASPEVDEAWRALGTDYRAVIVPEEHAEAAGLKHDQVKIRQKHGGGFPANVEGLHQLHCLNLLRQGLWYNFEYYHEKKMGAFKNADNILELHITHCLDILRQQLMCTVDIGVLGQVWWNQEEPTSFVDFNTQHRCRNFEAIRQWAEVRQLPEDVPEDFLEPPKIGDTIYKEIP